MERSALVPTSVSELPLILYVDVISCFDVAWNAQPMVPISVSELPLIVYVDVNSML